MKSFKLAMLVTGSLAIVVTGCGSPGNSTSNSEGSSQSGSTNKKIIIGYFNWDEDVAATYLWKNLLSQKGYDVQLKSVALGPMFEGLAQNGVNVFFDSWMPQQTNDMKQYGDKLSTFGKWYQGPTKEGFVVPTYMKNVNTIGDLAKVQSQLRGEVVGIDPGAIETTIAKKSLSAYGLNFNLQTSSSPAMLSALKKAYDAKQPIVVTLWSPHWAFAKYHLKYLKDPKGTFGKAGYIQGLANKTWATQHQTAMTWLKNFKLTPNQLGTLEDDINQASSPDSGVKKWISDNQKLVNGWLKSST